MTPQPGRRPTIIALSDRGGGRPDDPGAVADWRAAPPGDRYITIRGGIVASHALRRWSAAAVAAYLAAVHAEFYNEGGANRAPVPGEGTWWRQLRWFNDETVKPTDRVLLPFSTTLLNEGLRALADEGLITRRTVLRSPTSDRRLSQQRMLYHDRFGRLDRGQRELPAERAAEADDAEAQIAPGSDDPGN